MYRKYFLLFGLLILLTSCDEPIAGDRFFKWINSLEESIINEDWGASEAIYNDFHMYYKDNYWKLQLFGDEEEYEGIHESINRLAVAIKRKEVTQALFEIASMKSFLTDIYSM